MTIIAELRISGPGTALQDCLRAAPSITLELERSVMPADGDPVLFLWASGGDFDAFEAAVPDDPTVVSYAIVDDAGDSRLYRVVVDAEETIDSATIDSLVGASRLSTWSSAEGLFFETRFPDWDALQRYVDLLRARDLEVSLRAVYPAGRSHHPERYGLSAKQWELLQRALERDYFAVPRGVELAELAAEFDISEQAASERLRRGLATLLSETVGRADDAASVPPGRLGHLPGERTGSEVATDE